MDQASGWSLIDAIKRWLDIIRTNVARDSIASVLSTGANAYGVPKNGGLKMDQAKRLKELEKEYGRLC